MNDGYIKVACATPEILVADIATNVQNIKKLIDEANKSKTNILIFPELSVTSSTCGDLFNSDVLLENSINALFELADYTSKKYPAVIIGLPVQKNSKIYNVAAFLSNGEILGIVPKGSPSTLCSKFSVADELPQNDEIILKGKNIPFGNDLIFAHNEIDEYKIGIEFGDDLASPNQPASNLAVSGATIIAGLSAITETVDTFDNMLLLALSASKRLNCGYALASAGVGESTQDGVCSGFNIICENGILLNNNEPFGENVLTFSEFDVKSLAHLRNEKWEFGAKNCRFINFKQKIKNTELSRNIKPNPFLPSCEKNYDAFAESILKIQSNALARRLAHTFAKKAVIGISGGLDSTLALLVTVRAMKILNRSCKDILAITMPCFGTTKRTRSNSEILCNLLGTDFKEINIKKAVKQHFNDIGQNENSLDVTYENSQARERTQVLMDIANKENGLVVGTGDLSELALGWATYNGDHMSMYGVNAGIPKTIVRMLVNYEAKNFKNELSAVLLDVINTPVSPELLPTDNGEDIAQKTEDLVGPYELHDFFIYHTVALGESPKKIFRLAQIAFSQYDKETIKKWLTVFTRRFFVQQFKRSCLPDGPQVFSISLSPRTAFKMPTDASYKLWLSEIEKL